MFASAIAIVIGQIDAITVKWAIGLKPEKVGKYGAVGYEFAWLMTP